MSTIDLTTAKDHPVALLQKQARIGLTDMYADGLVTAASYLSGYEAKNDVTFAALANGPLSDLREAFALWADADVDYVRVHGIDKIINAANALLGLGAE